MAAELCHQDQLTDRFGPQFWTEIIGRMSSTTIYDARRCEVQLDNCIAYLLARASLADPNAALVCDLEPDLAWHMFLLYTAEYCEFCRDVAGVYLHHDPASESALVNSAAATERTLEVFIRQGIGFEPEMWRDHVRYPNGAMVVPTGLVAFELVSA